MIRKPVGLTAPYRAEDDDDIQDYKKPWVGLTDEDIYSIIESNEPPNLTSLFEMVEWVAKAIEETLRKKNGC